jgi:hypothetical protein
MSGVTAGERGNIDSKKDALNHFNKFEIQNGLPSNATV